MGKVLRLIKIRMNATTFKWSAKYSIKYQKVPKYRIVPKGTIKYQIAVKVPKTERKERIRLRGKRGKKIKNQEKTKRIRKVKRIRRARKKKKKQKEERIRRGKINGRNERNTEIQKEKTNNQRGEEKE